MEKFKVLEEKNNPLFDRKEILIVIDSEITPSRKDTLKIISEKFSAKPEAIKINKIHGKFGSKAFSVKASIYKTREEKEQIEIKKKKESPEGKKKEAKPAESEKETKQEGTQ
jgi:ribosomal protein S24E